MYVFFITLYIALCAVNLASCAKGKDSLRSVTKCLLMPLLAVAAISYVLRGKGSAPSGQTISCLLIAAALTFGAAGDALLLRRGDGAFMAGAACFLAGHLAWMLTMRAAIAACPLKIIIAWEGASAILVFFLWRVIGKPRGVLCAGVMVYGLFLTALTGTGIAAVRYSAKMPSFMFLSGGVLFFISDGILAYDRFKNALSSSNFIIMLTYIAAQTLLAFSVAAGAAQ